MDRILLFEMDTSLRLEDRLNGGGIFVPYKARIVLILEENELWDEVVHSTVITYIVVGLPYSIFRFQYTFSPSSLTYEMPR